MPDPSTSSGFLTVLLLPALFLAIKFWNAYVAKRVIRTLVYSPDVFTIVAAGDVPLDSRDILEAQAEPLVTLGFERVAYLRVTDEVTPEERTRVVYRHPTERAFAVVGIGMLGGEIGIACDLLALCEDGTWVRSENGRGHQHLATSPREHFDDAFVTTFSSLWQAHRAACAAAPAPAAETPDLATLVAHLNQVGEEMVRIGVERGELVMEGPSRAMRTALGARRVLERVTTGGRQAAAAKLSQAEFKATRLPLQDQERLFAELTLMRELRRRAASPWLVLGITAAGFALSTFLTMDLTWLVLLMPALLLHELGHWAVMRLCGHSDARMAFVPFLGAVTMTQKPFAKPWQEVAMLLAGPLPGIVLGLVLLTKGATHGWPRVMHAGFMLVGLNGLNLLPLQPLDGGRIFHVLVSAGRPLLDLALRAIATVVFIGVAVSLGDPTLGLIGLAGIFVLRAGYRKLPMEKSIRAAPDYDAHWPDAERRRRVFAALSESPERRLGQWFETAVALELQVRTKRPPLWQALFWSGALAAVVGGIAFLNHAGKRWVPLGCPSIEEAKPVGCGEAAFASIPWHDVSAREGGASPQPSASAFRQGGFVWCESDDQKHLAQLSAQLQEAEAVGRYCGSLPWEAPDGAAPASRKNARQTLVILAGPYDYFASDSSKRLTFMDRSIASMKAEPWFDATTARLLRSLADPAQTGKDALERALAERIGPSPTGSCHRLVVRNVQTQFDERSGGTHADAGVDASTEEEPPMTGIRFSAELASPADFAPLGAFLCQAGCRLRIAPQSPGAPALQRCF